MKPLSFLENIKACIFDMDGTLVDSLSIWDDIDERFFHSYGMEVPANYGKELAHMSFMEMAEYTKETYHIPDSVETIAQTWINWSKDAYLYTIVAKPGVKEFLDYLKSSGMPLALATANRRSLYEPCLVRNQLDSYFDFIANVNDLNTAKDEPKIYLHLASQMHAKPEETLVFEDILQAVKTAHDAHFKVVGVYDKRNDNTFEEIKNTADYYIMDYQDLLK
jgi:HAD superfamily hydrolase (TIGR01509 family)